MGGFPREIRDWKRGRNTIYCRLTGTVELERRLRMLEKGVRLRVVKQALRRAGEPIVQSARAIALTSRSADGRRTGGLSKSIRSVVRNYARKVLCVIGPIYGKQYTRLGRKHVPAKIAHLVEFGHRQAAGGELAWQAPAGWTSERVWSRKQGIFLYKHGAPRRRSSGKKLGRQAGFVPGQPFLRPAWDSQRAQAQTVLERELAAGIETEAAR